MSPRVSSNHREQYLQERREQILNAAIEVFGEKGFAGANVADIAKAAGVAKGTIYLYFASKEEIFKGILVERSFIPHLTDLIQENQPLEVTLRKIAESFYQYLSTYLPIFRLIIADAYRFPEHARQAYLELTLKGNQVLADYLAQQSQSGVIRPLYDLFLTARAFMGMIITYTISQDILGGNEITPIQNEDWIREMLQLFLEGVSPKTDNPENS